MNLRIGNYYNFKHEPWTILVYRGKQGVWNQFTKKGCNIIWCEVLDEELYMIEETRDEPINN